MGGIARKIDSKKGDLTVTQIMILILIIAGAIIITAIILSQLARFQIE